jgi:uncharacterized protein involved in exopolysaccharide biosynthesis
MNAGETRVGVAPTPLSFLSRRALRFWKSAALVGFLGCAASVVLARRADQPYRSEMVLMVEQGMPREGAGVDPMQGGSRLKDQLFAGQRLSGVVKQFKLFPELPHQQALEEVKKRLQFVAQPGGTFAIAYVGTSPAEAHAVTKRLGETLIADHNSQRGLAVRETRTFLDGERLQLEDDVRKRETALKEFLAVHPEATTAEQPEPMMEDPGVMMLEQELARMHSQARPGTAAGGGPVRSASEVLSLREQVESERAKAERDLREKLDNLTDQHPDVILARERVKRAQSDSARFARASAGSGAAAGTAAAVEDPEMKRSIRELEGRIGRMRVAARSRLRRDPVTLQLAVQLGRLRADLGEARERMSKLEDQRSQARVVEKMETSGSLMSLKVLDPATVPGSPLQSRRRRIALAGLAIACLLAAGTAFGRAALSDRVFDRDDVLQFTGVGVLTVVPRLARGGARG